MTRNLTIHHTRFSPASCPPTRPVQPKPEPEEPGLGVTRLVATLATLAALVCFALLALPARAVDTSTTPEASGTTPSTMHVDWEGTR